MPNNKKAMFGPSPQELDELKQDLIDTLKQSEKFYFTEHLALQFGECPLCGDTIKPVKEGFGIIEARIKETTSWGFTFRNKVTLAPRKAAAVHTNCLRNLEIWPDPDVPGLRQLVVCFDKSQNYLLVPVSVFISCFNAVVISNQFLPEDIMDENEYSWEEEENKAATTLETADEDVSVVQYFHRKKTDEEEWDEWDKAYGYGSYYSNKEKDKPPVVKKIKLYAEVKCNDQK